MLLRVVVCVVFPTLVCHCIDDFGGGRLHLLLCIVWGCIEGGASCHNSVAAVPATQPVRSVVAAVILVDSDGSELDEEPAT